MYKHVITECQCWAQWSEQCSSGRPRTRWGSSPRDHRRPRRIVSERSVLWTKWFGILNTCRGPSPLDRGSPRRSVSEGSVSWTPLVLGLLVLLRSFPLAVVVLDGLLVRVEWTKHLFLGVLLLVGFFLVVVVVLDGSVNEGSVLWTPFVLGVLVFVGSLPSWYWRGC